MKKYLALALATLISFPAVASVTDSLLIGGFAGLTAGFLSSALSRPHRHCQRRCRRRHCRSCRPVVVEERVYYKRPVVVERPVIVEQPIFVADFKERELALKEQQMQLELLKAENRRKELAIKEKELALKIIKSN